MPTWYTILRHVPLVSFQFIHVCIFTDLSPFPGQLQLETVASLYGNTTEHPLANDSRTSAAGPRLKAAMAFAQIRKKTAGLS